MPDSDNEIMELINQRQSEMAYPGLLEQGAVPTQQKQFAVLGRGLNW